MKKTNKQKDALEAIAAWRTLYYDFLLNDKESASIKKKINTKYGKYLSPLRANENNEASFPKKLA